MDNNIDVLQPEKNPRDVALPVVNLNGTSRARLVADHIAAIEALRAAQHAVQSIRPNGRDYPDGNLKRAQEQAAKRWTALDDMIADLNLIAEHVAGVAP